MRKKLLAVLMTGAMVASFAGSATAVFAKSDDDNKLTVWAWDQNFNIKSMQIAADQYAKDHEGFSVDIVETSSDDCQTKLTTAANAGDYSTLPDIVLMQDNSYQKYLKSYPDAFTDLKDININWDDFGKLKQSYSMVDDTHYGVPFDNGAVIACYRTDILDEAGYTIDDLTDITWSKFMEIGKDVHEKTGKYLLTSEATGGDTLMMMMQSCGANFVNEDGEAYIVGNEVAEKCINLYVDLVKNDVVKLVNNWDEYIATITGGEAAGIVNGNWITATLMSTEDQKGLWQITTMPKVDDVDTATNYANNGGSSWYVTSNCQNVELAEDFLASTFGSSTEFYDAILPEAGAISCYLPAGESKVYNENLEELSTLLDLRELLKTPARNLSLGQRMRCEIAASLLHNPKVLFLDEPTIGLDAISKIAVRKFVKKINKERGTTVIITTHDMQDIEALTERVLLIGHGKILLDGNIDELKRRTSTEKKIDIKYDGKPPAICNGMKCRKIKQNQMSIFLDPHILSVPDAIAFFAAHTGLTDISVSDISTEEMVATLYKEYDI